LNRDGEDDAQIRLAADRVLELAQRLPQLWHEQDNFEKRKLVDLLYSNCKLDGRSLSFTYRKPFSFIAEGRQKQDWLGDRDSNPDTVVQSHVSCRWTISQRR
jgi:hypothetical protein